MLITCIRAHLTVQILGVILSLIPGTSECTWVLPRLVRGIYWMQVNCVTDLGNCRSPLSLVVSRRYPEGRPAVCVFRVAVFCRVRFRFVVASISGVGALRSTASGSASGVGYSGPTHCVKRRSRGARSPLDSAWSLREKTRAAPKSLAHYHAAPVAK